MPVKSDFDEPADFEGNIDRIEDGWILGWAWRPSAPNTPIEIEMLVDGLSAGTWKAALFRPDLESAGKGNGVHAFEVPLRQEFRDGAPHQVRVVYAGTDLDLSGGPARIQLAGRDATPAAGGNSGPVSAYHSPFGGLWTDLPNAADVIAGKQSLGWISSAEAQLLTDWVGNGFVILTQAVPHGLIDQLDLEVDRIWCGMADGRFFVEFWENGEKTIQRAGPLFKDKRVKLLDLFAHSECARRIVLAPPIVTVPRVGVRTTSPGIPKPLLSMGIAAGYPPGQRLRQGIVAARARGELDCARGHPAQFR